MAANEEEVTDEDEAEWYSRRLDAGLSSLQNADYVLAWVCMEEDGVSYLSLKLISQLTIKARAHAHTMLKRKSQSFANVVKVLEGMWLDSGFNLGDMLTRQSSEIISKMTRMKKEKYRFHYKR